MGQFDPLSIDDLRNADRMRALFEHLQADPQFRHGTPFDDRAFVHVFALALRAAKRGKSNPQYLFVKMLCKAANGCWDCDSDDIAQAEHRLKLPARQNSHASLAAESPSQDAAMTQEHRATLQAMNLDELRELLQFVVHVRDRKRFEKMIDQDEDPRAGTGRLVLLEAMHKWKTGQPVETLSSTA